MSCFSISAISFFALVKAVLRSNRLAEIWSVLYKEDKALSLSSKKPSMPPHFSTNGRHKLLFSRGMKLVAMNACAELSVFIKSVLKVDINKFTIFNPDRQFLFWYLYTSLQLTHDYFFPFFGENHSGLASGSITFERLMQGEWIGAEGPDNMTKECRHAG